MALLFTIAVGVGSNVVIHDLARGLTGRALPRAAIEGVVSIFGRDAAGRAAGPIPRAQYVSVRRRSDLFEWVAAAEIVQQEVRSGRKSPVLSVAAATPALARLFGLPLDRGAVLGESVRERYFGGPEGATAPPSIDGREFRVAGSAPQWLEGLYDGRPIDLWVPMADEAGAANRRVWLLARLRAGVAADRAAQEIDLQIVPYTGAMPDTTEGARAVGVLLRVASALVVFIACANVAALQLGRAARRAHETSMRVALGSSGVQLAHAALSDSLVVSLVGGIMGVLAAWWTARLMPALMLEEDSRAVVLSPDLGAALAIAAVVVGLIVACGLSPVIDTPQGRPADVLRLGSLGVSAGVRKLRTGLVAAQMACCCLLVFSAGYLSNGLREAVRTTVGRRLRDPLLASVTAGPGVGLKYFADIEAASKSVAGVAPLAWAARLPGNRPAWRSFRIEPRGLPLHDMTLDVAALRPASLSLFALPPKAGRLFRSLDLGCPTAVVNDEAAATLFGDATVGRTVHDDSGAPVVVIGVVALKNPRARAHPTIYFDPANGPRSDLRGAIPSTYRAASVTPLDSIELDANVVSPEYFAVAGLALVSGRIVPDDPRARRCRVALVNEEAAPAFGGDAAGAAVIDDAGERTDIIGVVRSPGFGAFERRAAPAIYLPMTQDYLPRMTLLLAAQGDTAGLAGPVRRALEAVPGAGPDPIVVRTLDQYLNQTSLAPLRIAMLAMRASAALGLALSLLGLYGTLGDAARRQQRELAIRIALGARPRHVIARILQDGARIAAPGAIAGFAGSLLLSRLLAVVAQTAAPPFAVWAAGPFALAAAVAIASIVPARRSVLADPGTLLHDA